MTKSLYEYTGESGRRSLLAEWDAGRNYPLTPRDVSFGSTQRVWWRCEKGHSWQAIVSSRAGGGCGCPVCAGKIVIPGINDLASHFPLLAAEWHPTENGSLSPEQVTPFSNRRVWWQCGRGHAWIAAVAARTKEKSGCPYCTGRRVLPGYNDLATEYPQIAAQWCVPLNGELTPQHVTSGSKKKVWWVCPGGHVWRAVIYSRTGDGCGCPVCAGKTNVPYRLAQDL